MRLAILSDIHGNRTALEAVLADLQQISPDLILHGGDLADSGANPTEIVDHIRDLGWQGVMGNTDEMLVRPDALEAFARQSSAPPEIWNKIREIAAATRSALGEERMSWLRELPMAWIQSPVALVHASPHSCLQVPAQKATETELENFYASLHQPTVVDGHTHLPSIRRISGHQVLINTGSVGLPYDGDSRSSYLLLEEGAPSIRRVEYSVEKELKALSVCGLPHTDWTAKMLRTASPQLP